MEYKGKLYGHLGNRRYFDTGKTADDWDNLEKQISELKSELEVTDRSLADRQKLLDSIPECNVHGKCVPHALEWIEQMKKINT